MFYDLCFGQEAENQFVAKDKLAMAILLGYDCTAVNRSSDSDHMRWGSMEGSRVAPELMQSLGPSVQSALLSHQGLVRPAGVPPRQMAQLTRITFEGDQGSAAAAAALQLPGSRLRQTFDIVAIKPNGAISLVKACQALDVDIVTLDLSISLGVKTRVAGLAAAVRRGIHFELLYRPAVTGDDRSRTLVFARAKRLCQALRGRNIILSSGAEAAFDLRGPYDIINIASLLGLNPADAKAAISSRCEAVLRHAAEAKRRGISVTVAATAPPRQIADLAVTEQPRPPQLPQLQVSQPPQIVEAGAHAEVQQAVQQAAELNLPALEQVGFSGKLRAPQQTLPGPAHTWASQQGRPFGTWQAAWEDPQHWQQQLAEVQRQAEVLLPVDNGEQSAMGGSQARQLQPHPPGPATQELRENAASNASGSARLAGNNPRLPPLPLHLRDRVQKQHSAAGLREPMAVASQPAAVGGGSHTPGDMGNAPAAAQRSEPQQVQASGTSIGGAQGSVDPALCLAQPKKRKGKKGKGAGLGVLTAMFKPKQGTPKKKKKKKKTKKK